MRRRPAGLVLATLAVLLSRPAQGEDGRELYERMRSELFRHQTYTAVYEDYSARGKNHEINAFRVVAVKCIQTPKWYCGTILESRFSFPDQMTPGYQECYTESDDLSRLVLPGPYRMLGVIPMFPEDPKAYYLNGENLKYEGVWDYFLEWDRMLKGGSLRAEPTQWQGKSFWLLTIQRGEIPDPDYHLDTCQLWVDPDTWFPMRLEYFRPAETRSARRIIYRELKLSAPLSAQDMKFQGLAPGWNLARPALGPGLDQLTPAEPKLVPGPAPAGPDLLTRFETALQPLQDYTAILSTRFRYHRLRLLKQDRYLYLRPEQAFALETISLAANYILLGASPGSRMFYAPGHSPLIHLLPAGIYKVMGEQTFTRDDPRLFSSLGDNVQNLDFFTLYERLKAKSGAAELRTALSTEPAGWMLELKTLSPTGPREPKIMRLFLDPETSLPTRVEFLGYDDPQGFCQVDFSQIQMNRGLTLRDLTR